MIRRGGATLENTTTSFQEYWCELAALRKSVIGTNNGSVITK